MHWQVIISTILVAIYGFLSIFLAQEPSVPYSESSVPPIASIGNRLLVYSHFVFTLVSANLVRSREELVKNCQAGYFFMGSLSILSLVYINETGIIHLQMISYIALMSWVMDYMKCGPSRYICIGQPISNATAALIEYRNPTWWLPYSWKPSDCSIVYVASTMVTMPIHLLVLRYRISESHDTRAFYVFHTAMTSLTVVLLVAILLDFWSRAIFLALALLRSDLPGSTLTINWLWQNYLVFLYQTDSECRHLNAQMQMCRARTQFENETLLTNFRLLTRDQSESLGASVADLSALQESSEPFRSSRRMIYDYFAWLCNICKVLGKAINSGGILLFFLAFNMEMTLRRNLGGDLEQTPFASLKEMLTSTISLNAPILNLVQEIREFNRVREKLRHPIDTTAFVPCELPHTSPFTQSYVQRVGQLFRNPRMVFISLSQTARTRGLSGIICQISLHLSFLGLALCIWPFYLLLLILIMARDHNSWLLSNSSDKTRSHALQIAGSKTLDRLSVENHRHTVMEPVDSIRHQSKSLCQVAPMHTQAPFRAKSFVLPPRRHAFTYKMSRARRPMSLNSALVR